MPFTRTPRSKQDEKRKAEERKKKFVRLRSGNRCRFCRDKVDRVDYKDVAVLLKLCTSQGKFYSRKRSGNCAHHQRQAGQAVKRARFLALLPYVGSFVQ